MSFTRPARVVLFVLLQALLPHEVIAQDLVSAFQLGDVGDDQAEAAAEDGRGGIWLAGTFTDQIDLDPGPAVRWITRPGQLRAFVVHLSGSARVVSVGDFGAWPLSITRLVVEGDGSVALAGVFWGTADFDPGPGEFVLSSETSNYDGFVLRLSPTGQFRWAGRIGGGDYDSIAGLAATGDGGLVVAGHFGDTADLDPGPNTFYCTSAGARDSFLLQVDRANRLEWVGVIGGTYSEYLSDIAIAPDHSIVAVGSFFGTIDVDPGPGQLLLKSKGSIDGFVVVLRADHSVEAGARLGGGIARAAFDPEGRIVIAGSYSSGADLDPDPAIGQIFLTRSFRDIFVSRLTKDLGAAWIRTAGGYADEEVSALALDQYGGIYVAGTFPYYMAFGEGDNEFQFSGGDESFLWNVTFDGNFDWASRLHSLERNNIRALVPLQGDELLLAGSFEGEVDLDLRVPEHLLDSRGNHDAFVARISDGNYPRRSLIVPDDHATIQAAIDNARPFDAVLVRPGAYQETIDFHGQHVVLKALGDLEESVLDGSGQGTVVTFREGEGRGAGIEGFTIRNGAGEFGGGGLSIVGWSSPRVIGNSIEHNSACALGGGIVVGASAKPLILKNRITDNFMTPGCSGGGGGGGGIYVDNTQGVEIIQNYIAHNSWANPYASGGGIGGKGEALILNNTIVANYSAGDGGGVAVGDKTRLIQNIIVDNEAAGRGGGAFWWPARPYLVSNTFSGNRAGDGSAVFVKNSPAIVEIVNNIFSGDSVSSVVSCLNANPTFLNNDFFNASGPAVSGSCDPVGQSGNVSVDPGFEDSSAMDFRLKSDSPVIDAGDSGNQLLPQFDFAGAPRVSDGNLDGTVEVDIGSFEVQGPVSRVFEDGFEDGGAAAWSHPSGHVVSAETARPNGKASQLQRNRR